MYEKYLCKVKHLAVTLMFCIAGWIHPVQAQEPLIGEIIMFAGNFAPRGWALCDGQLLSISGNEALFSILGTTYGGDGRTTFALPDLRGRVAMHAGNGPGLSNRRLGERGGVEQVTLNATQLPAHTHRLRAHSSEAGDTPIPTNAVLSFDPRESQYNTQDADVDMGASAIASTGEGQPHSIVQPYQAVNYIIALQGIYPSRN